MKPTRAEIIRVMREWVIALQDSFTCQIGPHKGEIVQPHVRREIRCIKEAIRLLHAKK